ncbi:class I SAM-dependent methyltransferase [Euzebya tangerina]|uniref:class I SAM-dependent methyltransferase n=1 Tax=Euzebya tangerina TaxID=591198 RepID=UPI00196AAED1|nr:class I SAM-dependent methyltransferase [Euzebya tangerina]
MLDRTRRLWDLQNRHLGDRHRLFAAVARAIDASRVLYPGSFVDIAPSFVWPAVTYVDVDRRAKQFFDDVDGVHELLTEHGADPAARQVRFLQADYHLDLDLADGEFDLLISLYAGFISDPCTRFLRPGGHLLVNPSHGDVAMASIDPRYELQAVVRSRGGEYAVSARNLDAYLVQKTAQDLTPAWLRERGRGVAYTRSPFAYLFRRVE